MKKLYKSKKINNVTIISVIVCSFVFLLTFGFSAIQSSLDISDIGAIVRIQKDIRITSVTPYGSANGGTSSYDAYNVNKFGADITLPNSNSTVTYEIKITNLGNIEMGIHDVLGLPSNLAYTIDDYTLDTKLCDDVDNTLCKLGSVTTIHVTIGYSQNGYDSSLENKTFPFTAELKFQSLGMTARIGNQFFETLEGAIKSVNTTAETTIVLLKDTAEENIAIGSTQNLVFDFQGNTVSNVTNKPVFENKGTVKLISGTITSSADQGAFNNSGGTFTMTGGRIVATGGRQAVYNSNSGTVNIEGTAYLVNNTTLRGAVQNQAGCNLNITGGTIISNGSSAVDNRGTMVIGTPGNGVSITSPVMQGTTYGVTSTTNYSFYDGIMKGKSAAVNNVAKITTKETNYFIKNGTEVIGDQTYKTITLETPLIVTFNPNGGTVSETTRSVLAGNAVGTLPVPTRSNYVFDDWYTKDVGGEKVSASTIINEDTEFFAHWINSSDIVTAMIGSQEFPTLQAAINSVTTSSEVQIDLVKNTNEIIKITANKNIKLNLGSYTLGNLGNHPVIENHGIVKIINGTITSNVDYAAIDNYENGRLIMTGGSIIATGTRQAIYNNAGAIVEISGDAYLSSTASGKPNNTDMERGTIQNMTGGRLTITGGTLIGVNQQAVSNEGTLVIGIDDGNVNVNTPVFQGNTYGVKSLVAFEFYDGIIKGKSPNAAIQGIAPTIDSNSTLITSTENISGTTYNTAYLN